jgi:hypothetical protein
LPPRRKGGIEHLFALPQSPVDILLTGFGMPEISG